MSASVRRLLIVEIYSKINVSMGTSVISYRDQQDAPTEMALTHQVWEKIKSGKYDVYISDVVLRELNDCKEEKRNKLLGYLKEIQFQTVEITDKTMKLAEKFIDFGVLKKKSFDDCQHIAAAIVSDCDIIISWNFKHIVNVKTIRGVKVITTMEGFKDLLIYQPTALLEEE